MKVAYPSLDVEFDEETKLLSVNGDTRTPEIRRLSQMRDALYDKRFSVDADPGLDLYYVYRDVTKRSDRLTFEANQLRFDVTIMPELQLGTEFNKTLGHFHQTGPSGFSYPELYEVITGKAHYLLQAMNNNGPNRVILVEAREGERVLIPPGWWHCMINPSDVPLVTSNLLSRGVVSDYRRTERRMGAAYFELSDGSLVVNESYERVPELGRAPPEPAERASEDPSLYSSFVRGPQAFRFLNHPEEFRSMWSK